MAARIAEVHADVRADVRAAVERNDAALVNHLIAENDVAWDLQDLVPVVVHNRNYRTQQASADAAVVNIEIFPGVGLAAPFAGHSLAAAGFFPVLLGFGSQSGEPAVGWIDDERGLPGWFAAFIPVRRRSYADFSVAGGGGFRIGLGLFFCLFLFFGELFFG